MVLGEEQHVVLGGQPDQQGPQQRTVGQVERLGRRRFHERLRGGLVGRVHHCERHVGGVRDDHCGAAVGVGREAGALRLVPLGQPGQGGTQRVHVQWSAHP